MSLRLWLIDLLDAVPRERADAIHKTMCDELNEVLAEIHRLETEKLTRWLPPGVKEEAR